MKIFYLTLFLTLCSGLLMLPAAQNAFYFGNVNEVATHNNDVDNPEKIGYSGSISSTDWPSVINGIADAGTPPTVALTVPLNSGTYFTPATISLEATASDADGTISKVEFYRGNTKLGEALAAPYTFSWTNVSVGTYSITARATDNDGLTTPSAVMTVTVINRPTISSFEPTIGAVGVGVVIKGTNLDNITDVRIGGVAVKNIYVASPQLLYASAEDGALTGKVEVDAGGATVTSNDNFTVTTLASGSWADKVSPSTRRAQHGVVAANNFIYVFGGYNTTGLLNSIEIFKPTTGVWTTGADMPVATQGMAVAADDNGDIYSIGGFTTAPTGAVFRYSPKNNSWTQRANMPTPVYAAAAAAVNGKIYVFGGQPETDSTTTTNTTHIYDIATNKWSVGADLPTAVKHHSAVTGADGKIYVFGGRTAAGTPLALVQIYDPAANTWTTGTDMPIPKVQFGAVLANNGRIYIVGGKARITNNKGPFFHTVEIYDPNNNTWAAGPELRIQVGEMGAVNSNGGLYVIGGTNGTFRNYNFLLAPTPAAPTGLTATAVTATQVTLNWTDNADNETRYILEWARSVDGPYTVLATLPANTVSYAISSLAPNSFYYFRVKAVNAAVSSDYSNTSNAITPIGIKNILTVLPGVVDRSGPSSAISFGVYPNPLISNAHISLTLPQDKPVHVGIYNMHGQMVSLVYKGPAHAGVTYRFTWNAATQPPGTYFFRVMAGEDVVTKKLIVASRNP